MHRRLAGVASLVIGALALSAGPASAATKDVKAAGNPFTGGLAFDPADIGVGVGDIVRWTNTDAVVPHTATEDHGLWDLAGDYGADPFPRGFGPGETRERAFEAGTQRYYCKVHPEQMRGVVRVPVQLKLQQKKVKVKLKRRSRKARKRRRRRRYRIRTVYTVVARWAASVQPGLVIDVQYRRAGRDWKTLRQGSGETGAAFRGGTKRRATWEVRARLRQANSSSRHTDWSPVASVTT
jgi:plastocyanin